MIKNETELGCIIYADSSIANIVGINVMEVPGVVGMASKNATDGIWQLLGRENFSKGIKITSENNEVVIEISVIVCYGTKLSEVAKNILAKVKYNVEALTELKVKNIVVSIEGVKVQNN